MTLIIMTLGNEGHYASDAQCGIFIVMQNASMLSIALLSVTIMSVIIHYDKCHDTECD